jgi:orotate phosphoribosyltransferase
MSFCEFVVGKCVAFLVQLGCSRCCVACAEARRDRNNQKMKDFQKEFIDFAIETDVIRFGSFQLKSGRQSPYFFNAGLFNTGETLTKIGSYYAAALEDAVQEGVFGKEGFHVLFGPAYKGIPLVAATSIALFTNHGRSLGYSFNRKVAKAYGEGGNIVGTPLSSGTRVVIVDDVITAGTAIRETVEIINSHGAVLAGVLIALDRQERTGPSSTTTESNDPKVDKQDLSKLSAIQQVEKEFGVPVVSIVKLDSLINHLASNPTTSQHVDALAQYRKTYGA